MTREVSMKKISSLVLILFFPFRGIAQDIDPYELTLEQLGQIHIYTASRSLTTIEEAPSIVTVITAMTEMFGSRVKLIRVQHFIFLYQKNKKLVQF